MLLLLLLFLLIGKSLPVFLVDLLLDELDDELIVLFELLEGYARGPVSFMARVELLSFFLGPAIILLMDVVANSHHLRPHALEAPLARARDALNELV